MSAALEVIAWLLLGAGALTEAGNASLVVRNLRHGTHASLIPVVPLLFYVAALVAWAAARTQPAGWLLATLVCLHLAWLLPMIAVAIWKNRRDPTPPSGD